MKKNIKKLITTLMLFALVFTTFVPYLESTPSTPKKGDLKYDGTTSYIGADSEGKDTGLVTKVDQYTSTNGGSVEVSAGLFSNATNNDVTTINQLSENDVEVRKTVTKVNDNGEYKVKFEDRGKGTKLQVKAPVYVVVVFDNSNSMAPTQSEQNNCVNWERSNNRCYDKWQQAVDGAKEFARIIHNNIPSANIALVSFAGKYEGRYDYTSYSDSQLIRNFSASNFAGLNEENGTIKIPKPSSSNQEYEAGGSPECSRCLHP